MAKICLFFVKIIRKGNWFTWLGIILRIINKNYDFLGRLSTTSTMAVRNNGSTETVVVDGANQIISSSSVKRIFGDDFDWNWLPLYDGKNELTIEGNCDVTLEYRTVIKCGEY